MSNLNVALMNQLGLTPGASAAAGTAGTAANLGSSQLNQSDFLQLMTAQLSNQDPTQPMDSSQFMAQISQFSMVSGVQDMQKSIQQLATSLTSNQAMQATSLVGHQVVAAGSGAELGTNGALSGAIDLPQAVNDLKVDISDSSGKLVQTVDLGAQGAGLVPFTWNGVSSAGANSPSGIYKIAAQAEINGTRQALTTYVASTVNSVTVNGANQQVTLNTSNGESVQMNNVQQIM